MDQNGFRTKKFTIATTLTNTRTFSRDWIGSAYRSRWLVELDIRAINVSLGMDQVRAKSPAMLRTEIWSCLLSYNLIRMKMLQTATLRGKMPRSLSFSATLQTLGTTWVLSAVLPSSHLVELGSICHRSQQWAIVLIGLSRERTNSGRRYWHYSTSPERSL